MRLHSVEAPGSPATHWRTRSQVARQKPPPLEPAERGVNRASGDVALHTVGDFSQNRPAVRLVVQPEDREQHRLFEGTKDVSHDAYIVVDSRRCQEAFLSGLRCAEAAGPKTRKEHSGIMARGCTLA